MMFRSPRPVLIVTPWYPPSVGGVAQVAERLRKGLGRAGIASHVLVTLEKSGLELVDPERSVWHYRIPSIRHESGRVKSVAGHYLRGPLVLFRLIRLIRNLDIGNVIMLYPLGFGWPFVSLSRRLGLRLITSVHGNDVERFDHHTQPLQRLQRRTLAESDHIVACAPHLAKTARALVPEAELAVTVIPNGVDIDYFVPAPEGHSRDQDQPSLLHISNFAAKKRTCDIVEAFSRADLPATTTLTMVGDGPERARTEELAQRMGMAKRVRFPGAQDDVRPYFRDADALILASDSEGAPLVLLEAMASGVPWISTPWGAAADLPSGECGLVVPIGGIDALAEAMEEMIRNPEAREQMARRGREAAEAHYSIDVYIRRHVELLK